MVVAAGLVPPPVVAVLSRVAGPVRAVAWHHGSAVRRGVRRSCRYVQRSEENEKERRAGEQQQERASDQQVTSASMLRPRSVGLVTEM